MRKTGLTKGQEAKLRFLELVGEYHKFKRKGFRSRKDALAFISLSIDIHALKGEVPRRLWPLVNKAI